MSVDEVKRMKELAAILADPIGPGDAEVKGRRRWRLTFMCMSMVDAYSGGGQEADSTGGVRYAGGVDR
jgi:hypothetical protein